MQGIEEYQEILCSLTVLEKKMYMILVYASQVMFK